MAAGSLCNTGGQGCTVLAGKVGLAFADPEDIKSGKKASPENGNILCFVCGKAGADCDQEFTFITF